MEIVNKMKKREEVTYVTGCLVASLAFIAFAYIWISYLENCTYSFKANMNIQNDVNILSVQMFVFITTLSAILITVPAIICFIAAVVELLPINKVTKWFCPKSRVLCYLYEKYGDKCKLLERNDRYIKFGTEDDYVIVPNRFVGYALKMDDRSGKTTIHVNRDHILICFSEASVNAAIDAILSSEEAKEE